MLIDRHLILSAVLNTLHGVCDKVKVAIVVQEAELSQLGLELVSLFPHILECDEFLEGDAWIVVFDLLAYFLYTLAILVHMLAIQAR